MGEFFLPVEYLPAPQLGQQHTQLTERSPELLGSPGLYRALHLSARSGPCCRKSVPSSGLNPTEFLKPQTSQSLVMKTDEVCIRASPPSPMPPRPLLEPIREKDPVTESRLAQHLHAIYSMIQTTSPQGACPPSGGPGSPSREGRNREIIHFSHLKR